MRLPTPGLPLQLPSTLTKAQLGPIAGGPVFDIPNVHLRWMQWRRWVRASVPATATGWRRPSIRGRCMRSTLDALRAKVCDVMRAHDDPRDRVRTVFALLRKAHAHAPFQRRIPRVRLCESLTP